MERIRISSKKGQFICQHCVGDGGEQMSFTSYNSFLDHCNGRQHLRATGAPTKQERVDDPQRIRDRLALLRHRMAAKAPAVDAANLAAQRIEEQRQRDEAERRDRYARKKAALAKKKSARDGSSLKVIGSVELKDPKF